SVQRVEDDVRLKLGEANGDIALHVELGDVRPAALAQGRCDVFPAGQRDLTLGAPSALQHHDMHRLVHAAPTRWISHSSVMLVFACTRRRTSSPNASMSALVALPRFKRKLQCFSDTCAPPIVSPRHPAASISAHAL